MSDIHARLVEWRDAKNLRREVRQLAGDAVAEIDKLRAALKDCSDELAEFIEHHYAKTKDHPAMKRRYDRDMTTVLAARALLNYEQKTRE
jgi:hypothetical protein